MVVRDMVAGRTIVVLMYIGCMFLTSQLFLAPKIYPRWAICYIGLATLGCLYSYRILKNRHLHLSKMEKLFPYILLVSFIEILYGICHYLTAVKATFTFSEPGTFDNPSGYALCACSTYPFIHIFGRFNKTYKKVAAIISIVYIAAVFISGSRTGLLSIFILLLIYFANHGERLKWYNKIIFKIRIVFCITSFIILIYVLYVIKKDSADGRIIIWLSSLYMIKDAPLFGHGFGAVPKKYMDYQAVFLENHQDANWCMLADNTKHLFNEYLGIIVQFGIIGFAIFVFLAYLLIRCYMKKTSERSRCAFLSLISISVFSLFSYPLSFPFVWIILLLDISVIVNDVYGKQVEQFLLKYKICLFLLLSPLSIILGYQVISQAIVEIKLCHITNDKMLSSNQRLLQYKKIYDKMDNNPVFLYNYGVDAYNTANYELSLSLIKQGERFWADYYMELLAGLNHSELHHYDLAGRHLRKAHFMCPNRFEPLYYQAKGLMSQGKYTDAERLAKTIIQKKVKVPSEQIDQIKKEMYEIIIINNKIKNNPL